jgi:hypothetical protein
MLSLSLVQSVCQPTSHGFGLYTHDENNSGCKTWTGTTSVTKRDARIVMSTVAAQRGHAATGNGYDQLVLKDPITNGESSSPIFEQWKRALIV